MIKSLLLLSAGILTGISATQAKDGGSFSPYISLLGNMNISGTRIANNTTQMLSTTSGSTFTYGGGGIELGIKRRTSYNMLLGFAAQAAFSKHDMKLITDLNKAGWANQSPIVSNYQFRQADIGLSFYNGWYFPVKKSGIDAVYGLDAFISMSNDVQYNMTYRDVWDAETQQSYASPAMYSAFKNGDGRVADNTDNRTLMPYCKAAPFLAAYWNQPLSATSNGAKLRVGLKVIPAILNGTETDRINFAVFDPNKNIVQSGVVSNPTTVIQLSAGISF